MFSTTTTTTTTTTAAATAAAAAAACGGEWKMRDRRGKCWELHVWYAYRNDLQRQYLLLDMLWLQRGDDGQLLADGLCLQQFRATKSRIWRVRLASYIPPPWSVVEGPSWQAAETGRTDLRNAVFQMSEKSSLNVKLAGAAIAGVVVSSAAVLSWVVPHWKPWPVPAEEDFGTKVHSYLLDHPQVLREMGEKLEQSDEEERTRNFRQSVQEMRARLLAADGEPASGNPNADITILEFYDVECPFCKALAPDLERLSRDDGYIRLVYRPFPILGAASIFAAKAELAAQMQGLYPPFHERLMADQTPEHQLDEKRIMSIATAVGLDIGRLKKDISAPEIERRIADNKAIAEKLTIHGTPGLVFLGPDAEADYLSRGTLDYQAMKARLAELRLAARH